MFLIMSLKNVCVTCLNCNYCIIQVLTDLHFSVDYYLIKQNVSACSSYETSVVHSRNWTIPGVQPGNIYYLEITPYFENLGNSCSSTFFIQGLKNPCQA